MVNLNYKQKSIQHTCCLSELNKYFDKFQKISISLKDVLTLKIIIQFLKHFMYLIDFISPKLMFDN